MTQDSTTVRAAATKNWSAIPIEPIKRLQEQFQRHHNTLFLVTSRSMVLPPVPLFENSSHKQVMENAAAKKRIMDLRLQRSDDDVKKLRREIVTWEKRGVGGAGPGGGNGNNRHDAPKKGAAATADKPINPDKAGDLVYRSKGYLPAITYWADETKDCSAHLRQGVACRFGPKCKFLHTSIKNMPVDKQKRWYKLVLDAEGLDFDWERVPKSTFPLSFQHTNPAVPAAPTTP